MATFNGTEGNDTLIGGAAADEVNGNGGNDFLQGGDGIDTVVGGAGNDTMSGNGGNDWVRGGTGNDQVSGGSGQDSFAFADFGAANADTLVDFDGGWDNLQLDASAFTALGANGRFASGDARFFAGAAAHDADDRIIYNQATGQLWYDADGNGAGTAQLIATLSNRSAMSATDIWVFNSGGTPPPGAINGTTGNDTLVGTSGPDTINGLGGNDSLIGNEGSDQLNGGDGEDTLDAYNGQTSPRGSGGVVDTLDGGLGNDTYRYWHGGAVVQDAGGVDTIELNIDGEYVLPAGIENLSIIGSSNDNVGVTGNDLSNVIVASNEDDRIFGLGGNDSIDAGINHDNVDGGAGDDTIYGGDEGNINEQDILTGGAGADHFVIARPGGSLVDQITDFVSGTDQLRLDGRLFSEIGASGSFTPADARFTYGTAAFDASDRIIFNASTGQLFYDADGTGSQAQVLIASNLATPTATDFEVVNGTTPGSSIVGTDGNDSLVGTADNDTIDGLGGNDTIRGLGGDDRLVGGAGVDSIVGGDGNDTLIGHDGARDRSGVPSADTLDGGLGNDRYEVQQGDVILADAGGVDSVFADTTWTLSAGLENLRIGGSDADGASGTGNELDNLIDLSGMEHGGTASGLAGNDTILGAQHHTTLLGGTGNDSLVGQNFGNTFNGGAGNDTLNGLGDFVFDVTPGAANADLIQGFNNSDNQILLDGSVFTALGFNGTFAADDPRFFSAPGAHGGHDADDRIIFNSATTQLWYDADGSGSGAAQLIVSEAPGQFITAGDITVFNAPGAAINGTEGNDSLVGTTSNDTINGFGGNDTIDGGVGADSMVGGAGDDLYFVDNTGDVIAESENGGIDEVRPNISFQYTLPDWVNNLTLTGETTVGFGNAIENAMRGQDTRFSELHGADGNDTLISGAAGATMYGDAGNDQITGSAVRDFAAGGAGDDSISTGAGDDSVSLMFDGGATGYGRDTIDGGAGFDALEFFQNVSQSGINLNMAAGTVSNAQGSAVFTNIESVSGTNNNDLMVGDAGNNRLSGIFGNDTLDGGAGNDTLVGDQTSLGFQGADTFVFSATPGAANADSVSDFISGLDTMQLDATVMAALGASGRFSSSDARFFAGAAAHDADDRVIYNSASGQLWYDADGNGAGSQQLLATLSAGVALTASDIVVANGTAAPPPPDGTNGTEGNDTMIGTAGNDTLNGLGGNDFMQGQAGVDVLRGGAGNDTMSGNDGNDSVEGGAGNDRVTGGSGQDAFVFREFGAANADTLTDFDGNGWDNLRFDNAAFTALGADGRFSSGDARFFAGTAAHDADDRIIYNAATEQVLYDADGNGAGAAQLVATLQAGATLVASDIWVI